MIFYFFFFVKLYERQGDMGDKYITPRGPMYTDSGHTVQITTENIIKL